MAESTLSVIRKRRELMEDAAVLGGDGTEVDEKTKPWRALAVDGVKDNEKQTIEDPDSKPHMRRHTY